MHLLKVETKDFLGLGTEVSLMLLGVAVIAANSIRIWVWQVLKDKNKAFIIKTDNASKIHNILNELRMFLGANRACTFEFSNTKESAAQVPFNFISMTSEATDIYTAKIAHFFKEDHIGNYPTSLGNVSSTDLRYRLYNVDDIDLDDEIKSMMLHFGVRSCLMFKLRNELLYGMLAVYWTHDYYRAAEIEVNVTELDEKDWFAVENACKEIIKLKQRPKWYSVMKFKI